MEFSLAALPSLALWGLSTTVVGESEIGRAVRELRRRFSADDEIVLLYDGTRDDSITVSIGTVADGGSGAASRIAVPDAPEGVTVTFDEHPESIADAWERIDAELGPQGLKSFGVYRQINYLDGSVTLQAPVRSS